jgi:hypothetical protein
MGDALGLQYEPLLYLKNCLIFPFKAKIFEKFTFTVPINRILILWTPLLRWPQIFVKSLWPAAYHRKKPVKPVCTF